MLLKVGNAAVSAPSSNPLLSLSLAPLLLHLGASRADGSESTSLCSSTPLTVLAKCIHVLWVALLDVAESLLGTHQLLSS